MNKKIAMEYGNEEDWAGCGDGQVEQPAGIRKLASAVKRATTVSAARVHPNHHALMQHHFKRDG